MTTISILIPHDGSPASSGVIDAIGPLLSRGTRVTLLHVDEGAHRGEDEVSAVERRLTDAGAIVTRESRASSDPADTIVGFAEELQPDLVAMTTHGRTGKHTRIRGGVAERVLRACPVPLFMANPFVGKRSEISSALVPLQSTGESAEILDPLLRFAKIWGCSLTFLYVDFDDPTDTAAQRQQRRAARAKDIESWLSEPRKRAEGEGIEVTVRISHGTPWTEILNQTESGEFDLVAMTTHGRAGLSRWAFGSVAERVLRACQIPVLVHRMGKG